MMAGMMTAAKAEAIRHKRQKEVRFRGAVLPILAKATGNPIRINANTARALEDRGWAARVPGVAVQKNEYLMQETPEGLAERQRRDPTLNGKYVYRTRERTGVDDRVAYAKVTMPRAPWDDDEPARAEWPSCGPGLARLAGGVVEKPATVSYVIDELRRQSGQTP